MLKQLNFWVSAFIPQKAYWYLVGLINPWQAVLEDSPNPGAVYRRSKDIVDLLRKLKLINKQGVVLDIGCGVGRAEYKLAKEVKDCVGIDISPSMINLARKYVKHPNINFLVGNGKNLNSIKNSPFNLVFSILVFQHIPKNIFINYLKESFRVLKKNGKLLFQISIYQKNKPSDPLTNHPWSLRYYKPSDLKKILSKIGFKKIKILNVQGDRLGKHETQALIIAEKLFD